MILVKRDSHARQALLIVGGRCPPQPEPVECLDLLRRELPPLVVRAPFRHPAVDVDAVLHVTPGQLDMAVLLVEAGQGTVADPPVAGGALQDPHGDVPQQAVDAVAVRQPQHQLRRQGQLLVDRLGVVRREGWLAVRTR
jgi:hypothetical protein